MTPEDFSQFEDPRVRAVMAAAANLVESIDAIPEDRCIEHELWAWKNEELRNALFAAQHSKPKEDAYEQILKLRDQLESEGRCCHCGDRDCAGVCQDDS